MQSREEAPEPAAVSDEAVAAEASREATVAEDGGKSPASPSMDKERQIPVDPVSLRHLGMVADEDAPLSAPSVLTELVVQSPLLPPLRRPTFVGASLQCSAASSPATPSPTSSASTLPSLAQQHSVALAHYVGAPAAAPALLRSASRAEGRSMAPHDEPIDTKPLVAEDGFTCGALCMFIPGFTKKKPAAAASAAVVSSMQRQQSGARRRSSVSLVASLERFECGSWSPPPPAAVPAVTAQEADFALEVAKSSCADDAEAPVKMAFVFDGEPRGILKKSASSRQDSAPRASSASQRHVRFSTATAVSCPSSPCITPRLMRARAEFNAFLEAQSA